MSVITPDRLTAANFVSDCADECNSRATLAGWINRFYGGWDDEQLLDSLLGRAANESKSSFTVDSASTSDDLFRHCTPAEMNDIWHSITNGSPA